jgi:radical SAM superfamily enzyme YgiQ (UPF0313 family)
MDLARKDPTYIAELAEHHVGGLLKVAPEHTDPEVLSLMKKPGAGDFLEFDRQFGEASRKAKKKQHLVPYFIASHPGSDLRAMIDLALFLKESGHRPDQVQDFIPSPFDIAACMYHTGLDPMTMKPVAVAKGMRDRKMQRALLQFFKPENYFEVRDALLTAGRADLIGTGPKCLIGPKPPAEALDRRRARAAGKSTEQVSGDHIRAGGRVDRRGTTATKQTAGYRPHRAGAARRGSPKK